MRRALVLGGGAILGGYWEAGLLRGLSDSGFSLDDFDTIVGTSAGSLPAVALANGRLPESPDDTRSRRRAAGRSPDPDFPFDLSDVDVPALMEVFQLWASVQSPLERCVAIGSIALQNNRRHATEWIADFEANLSRLDWGKRNFLIVAVDAANGVRRVFRERDGVALSRVVAATCALPVTCPPVEIDGRFFMDGGVHSSTNADVLVAEQPSQVLIAMPTNSVTTRIGGFAERMLEKEVEALRAIGCDVRVATPTARDTQRFGPDLMDYRRIDDAYAAGLDAGSEWANALHAHHASADLT